MQNILILSTLLFISVSQVVNRVFCYCVPPVVCILHCILQVLNQCLHVWTRWKIWIKKGDFLVEQQHMQTQGPGSALMSISRNIGRGERFRKKSHLLLCQLCHSESPVSWRSWKFSSKVHFLQFRSTKRLQTQGQAFFSGKACSDSSEFILKFIPSPISISEIFSRYVYVFDY